MNLDNITQTHLSGTNPLNFPSNMPAHFFTNSTQPMNSNLMQGAFHNQNQRLNPYNLNGYPLRDHIPQYSIPLQIPTLSNKPSQSFPFEGNSI